MNNIRDYKPIEVPISYNESEVHVELEDDSLDYIDPYGDTA